MGKLFEVYSDTKLLPTLSNNIKCGNSLIGPDFYKGNLQLFDDRELKAKVNDFDWSDKVKGFGEIMAGGGFDCVLGNPPYGALFADAEKLYLNNKYSTSIKNNNSYVMFFERGIELLRKNGILSLLTSFNIFNWRQFYSFEKSLSIKGFT